MARKSNFKRKGAKAAKAAKVRRDVFKIEGDEVRGFAINIRHPRKIMNCYHGFLLYRTRAKAKAALVRLKKVLRAELLPSSRSLRSLRLCV